MNAINTKRIHDHQLYPRLMVRATARVKIQAMLWLGLKSGLGLGHVFIFKAGYEYDGGRVILHYITFELFIVA